MGAVQIRHLPNNAGWGNAPYSAKVVHHCISLPLISSSLHTFLGKEKKLEHFIVCPICQELHHYKISHQVLAFACPFLNGVIHLNFYSAKDIEEHKKEAEPKTWKNLFERRKEADDG